jgi:WD40 repeat protein/tRNA A-37 threonylcarbamoyl transferase component Bud32
MPHDFADRNLLFGLLALQTNFIDRDVFLAALHAWAVDPSLSLGEVLRRQGKLSPEQEAALNALVQARLGDSDPDSASETDPHSTVAHLPRLAAEGGSVRYRILRPHARGGLGEVFVALDEQLHREVALKEIQKDHASDRVSCARFVREAEITGGLEHPGVVPVYGLGAYPDGRPFYAMRFIQGETLRDAIQHFHDAEKPGRDPSERNLALRELLAHFVALGKTVAYAHNRGVLHRDLKPSNVLLGKFGETLVVDWGLAKPVGRGEADPDSSEATLRPPAHDAVAETQMGSALGTPSYMSPEQAAGRLDRLRPASDVYGLGATLYTLLTGRAPVQGRDTGDILHKVQKGDWLPPRAVKQDTPFPLDAICRRAMALRPEDRYGSALELTADVEHWLADEPVSAWPEPAAVRARRWLGRHRPLVAGVAAAVLVALVSLGVAAVLLRDAGERERLAKVDAQEKGEAAKKQGDAFRRNLYVAEMNLVQRSWEEEAGERGRELLEKWRAADDLRGFEWHYWRRLVHGEKRLMRGHVGKLFCVALSPDGEHLATGGEDGAVKIWAWRDGREVRTLKGHPNAVWSVAFSPDGKHLASGGGDPGTDYYRPGEVIIWDWRRGAEVRRFSGTRGLVRGLAFSPGGETLAAGDAGGVRGKPFSIPGVVRLWDVATGHEKGVYQGHKKFVTLVRFSPDCRRVASADTDGTLHLWDAATAQPHLVLQAPRPAYPHIWGLDFSPDGRQVASGHLDGALFIRDASSGLQVVALPGHPGAIMWVRYSSDGRRLTSCGSDGSVRVWDLSSRRALLTLKGHGEAVVGAVSFPGGREVATVGFDGVVRVRDITADPESLTLPGHKGSVRATAFSPDDRLLASAGTGRAVRVREVATGKVVAAFAVEHEVRRLAFSPDGKLLAAALVITGKPGQVKIWDVAAGREVRSINGHPRSVSDLAFTEGGKKLVTTTDIIESTARLWDVASGQQLRQFRMNDGLIAHLAVSPDGRLLATASGHYQRPARLRVWEMASGRELVSVAAHTDVITGVVFLPDGSRLATCSYDKTIRLWDTATGQEDAVFRGHDTVIHDLARSPDGRRLASASEDRTVRVWDVATGSTTLVLKGHSAGIRSVAFGSDGLRLASGDEAGMVKLWEALPPTAESWAGREPLHLVQFLFAQALPHAEVLKRLRADTTLSAAVRERALALAKDYPQDARLLQQAAWRVASRGGADADAYRLALARAEEAWQAEPGNAEYLGTVAAARYRSGQSKEAVDALLQADKLRTEQKGGMRPAEMALLAMARHRLGQKQEAERVMDRLRQWVREHPADGEMLSFLHEAEVVLREAMPSGSGKKD